MDLRLKVNQLDNEARARHRGIRSTDLPTFRNQDDPSSRSDKSDGLPGTSAAF